jgi:hypothetical protein
LIVKLPISLGIAAPVLVKLITTECYKDSKSLSLLMTCGAELFSLEEFFSSIYAVNGHFWRTFAIVGNWVRMGKPQSLMDGITGKAQTFLNGMTMVGENSGASSFLPGVGEAFAKLGKNDPADSATQMQDMFAGAGGRFGVMGLFTRAAINPIAVSHWMYRLASRIVVQSIEASQKKRSIGTIFWNVVSEGIADYDAIVATRMFNTCGGMALMAGYGSPLGNVILHFCFAGVKATLATLNLVSLFTVDIPVMACVCKEGVGQPSNWPLSHCDAPDRTKIVLRRLIDSQSQCSDLVTGMTTDLANVYDDVFGEMYAGSSYVGSVLDSFLRVFDGNAGNCDNYETNPYVSVLIPQPVDYWRVCTKTDVCRVRCKQQMEAFEMVRPQAVLTTSTQAVVESLFFPTISGDVYTPFPDTGILALLELTSCPMCSETGTDRCFIAGGFAGVNAHFQVQQYCVPSALGDSVTKAGQWETLGISGKSIEIEFIRIDGSGWQDVYTVVGMQDQLVQICSRLDCVELTPSDVDSSALGFDDMQILDNVGVFNVRTSGGLTSYCLRFSGGWMFLPCPTTNIWDQSFYHVVINSESGVLLLPYDKLDMQMCQLDDVVISGCTRFTGFDYQSVPIKARGKQNRVSQWVTKGYGVFIATDASSHWLQMLNVDTSGSTASASLRNSMSARVRTELRKACSMDSCVGCQSLSTQRLCYAAQQCLIGRCIGTMINVVRPLCAIGSAVEEGFNTYISVAQGVWLIVSETLTSVLKMSGGILKPVAVTWPDNSFFGGVCSAKNVIASQVSILTSAVNGIVQASVPIDQMRKGQAIDNRFLAVFSMTMTAITGFLYQLALAPLYALMAVQKTMVCETSSLIGVVTGNNYLTIGDPEIEAITEGGLGKCMTQVFTENSNGAGSGMDNAGSFIMAASQILTNLNNVADAIPLDVMKHPMDAFFTWLLGCISGLQDVLATADQSKYAIAEGYALGVWLF